MGSIRLNIDAGRRAMVHEVPQTPQLLRGRFGADILRGSFHP
jgi:hypothetical protein